MNCMLRITVCMVVLAAVGSLAIPPATAQDRQPLTMEDLNEMKQAGFSEKTIIQAIEANGAAVDTSARGLLALKNAGFGERVIQAILVPSERSRSSPTPSRGFPDDIGVYTTVNGSLEPLPVEIVSLKSSGMLKAVATIGIAKASFNGSISGVTSAMRLSPPVEIVLRTPDGTAPVEYQLLVLDSQKNRREFTVGKQGIAGVSLGDVTKNSIHAEFERVDRGVYRAVLTDLRRGEYGILAPGLDMTNLAAAGKMYTFSIVQ